MKITGFKKITAGLGLLFAVPAFASYELGQDRAITIMKADNQTASMVAFPASASCKNWYYVPGSLMVEGDFRSLAQQADTRVGDDNAGPGFISSFLFMANNTIGPADRKQMLQAILKKTADDKSCGTSRPASEGEIVLSPADAKIRSLPLVAKEEGGGAEFTQAFTGIYPTNSRGQDWEVSTNRRKVTFVTDLTLPKAAENLKDMIESSSSKVQELGQISMVLDGVVSHVKAELKVKVDMKAAFDTRLERTKCTTTEKVGGDGDAIMDGIVLLSNPPAHFAKKLLDSWFPSRTKTTVCSDELKTTFTSGDLSGYFDFNTFDTNMNDDQGRPIKVQPCTDRGECEEPITLEQFLKFELLTLYIQSNFSSLITKVGDSTFEATLGKRGTSESHIDVSGKYGRVIHARVVRSVPVFAKNLNPASFKLNFLNDPLYQCAIGKPDRSLVSRYDLQTRKYFKYIRTSPMPVRNDCYEPSAPAVR